MLVQPLVYGSADRGTVKGYQLLGRCDRMLDDVVQSFCEWAPSHGSLQSSMANAQSINFFPVSESRYAVTRSIYGGPEYSRRGGMQVVTLGLIVTHHQLSSYGFDPFLVADNAMALGQLILPASVPSSLNPVSLPDRPFDIGKRGVDDACAVDQVVDLLHEGERVVVVGNANPLGLARRIVASVRQTQRASISFSTGLKPSTQRRFQLQFVPTVDQRSKAQFEKNHVRCVACETANLCDA